MKSRKIGKELQVSKAPCVNDSREGDAILPKGKEGGGGNTKGKGGKIKV